MKVDDSQKNEIVSFKAGDTLFWEKDTASYMFVILQGQVEVFLGPRDQRIPLAIVNSGQFLGELSCLLGTPRSATAIALTNVSALKLKRDFIDETLNEVPTWVPGLLKCLADRIHDMNDILRRNKIVDEQLKTKMAAAESRIDKNKFA